MKPRLNNVSGVYAGVMGAWHIYKILTEPPIELQIKRAKGPFRPNEWDSQNPEDVAARMSIYDGKTTYFFDAVMRLEHIGTNRITEHPIQSGANIADHAFSLPKHLTLEIGMSDVMDTFVSGQFSDGPSKSISAYQTLEALRKTRLPLTVATRLETYQNMLIEQIVAPDDFKTKHGLKCIVSLKQIITAQVPIIQVVSKRKQVTQKTNRGPVQSKPLDNSSILSRGEQIIKSRLGASKTGIMGDIIGR